MKTDFKEKNNRCPVCGTKLKDMPGVGMFCPNKECDVLDNLDSDSVNGGG